MQTVSQNGDTTPFSSHAARSHSKHWLRASQARADGISLPSWRTSTCVYRTDQLSDGLTKGMKVLLWEFPTPLGFLPEHRLAKTNDNVLYDALSR